jgi:hypothetical protein
MPTADDSRSAFDAILQQRQKMLATERERQAARLRRQEAEASQAQAGVAADVARERHRWEAFLEWRIRQRERRKAIELDKLHRLQELAHQAELKAKAEEFRKKQAAYMNSVHHVAQMKRLKAVSAAAAKEEERRVKESHEHAESSRQHAEGSHARDADSLEAQAAQRQKEAHSQYERRRASLRQWFQQQVKLHTGLTDMRSLKSSRLTPEQRRTVTTLTLEHDRKLLAIDQEERQWRERQDIQLTHDLMHIGAQRDSLVESADRSEALLRADAQKHREGIVTQAEVRAGVRKVRELHPKR